MIDSMELNELYVEEKSKRKESNEYLRLIFNARLLISTILLIVI